VQLDNLLTMSERNMDESLGAKTSHRRSLLITSRSRQQMADILRQAYDQGWRPQIKNYMHATRFGRYRR
jgi:hypothetical protein